ncbi:hypothetical protein [Georgenia faecalis]|uniref:Uncharacterized protein n=1 Tax=Georgenia faecalis TaxID=2483799 RepID=A0ABV9D8N8_9MICO|nr:hypothetical protein [Georgenia faecalis]
MISFWVWALLVVAALVVVGLLGLRLWRSAVALGRELSVAGRLADRLSGVGAPALEPVVPGVVGDPELLAAARRTRVELRDRRTGRRHARAALAIGRWREHGLD